MTSPTNHCYYDKQNHQSNQKGNPRGSIKQNNRIISPSIALSS